jgi:simple sugar transport system ATP-binding protein
MVGVAGVEGNGQRELALVLAGRLTPDSGAVRLPSGIGFIPQDRTTEGVIADFDLVENVALAYQRRPEFQKGVRLRWNRLADATRELRERYDVAATSVEVPAGTLSGGNQQRVVVGREIEMASHLLVAENPTRGLDIAAAAFVHQALRQLCAQGVAVALVSTDLDEVLALSHRVFAMARGRLVPVPPASRTREGVGALMLGAAAPEREASDV